MRSWVICFLVLIAVPRLASAQGLFLQKGTSGYGATLDLSTDGGYSSYGAGIGGSYKGWLDANINVNRTKLDPDNWDGETVFADSVGIGVGIHPLKQSQSMPISLAIFAGSQVAQFRGMPIKAQTLSVGSTLYRFFKLGERFGVIPGLQFTYATTKFKIEGAPTFDEDGTSISLGGHFAWLRSDDFVLTLTPGITFSDAPTSFVLTVGALRALP